MLANIELKLCLIYVPWYRRTENGNLCTSTIQRNLMSLIHNNLQKYTLDFIKRQSRFRAKVFCVWKQQTFGLYDSYQSFSADKEPKILESWNRVRHLYNLFQMLSFFVQQSTRYASMICQITWKQYLRVHLQKFSTANLKNSTDDVCAFFLCTPMLSC